MSPWHILILLLIILLVVGSKRLPSMGRDLGKAFTGFKDGVTGKPDVDEIDPPAPRVEGVSDDRVDDALVRNLGDEGAVRARQTTPAPTQEIAEAEIADAKSEITDAKTNARR